MTSTPPVIDEEAKVHRKTCTDHCATCGEHFHGLGAFDAHRRDGYCLPPESAANKDGKLLLQMWTEDGSCDHVKGNWKDGRRLRWAEPVVIWQKAITDEQRARMQAAFGFTA